MCKDCLRTRAQHLADLRRALAMSVLLDEQRDFNRSEAMIFARAGALFDQCRAELRDAEVQRSK